ncbi:MAG: acetoacetate--CoA ligase [Nitrososphaerota archaeon]
MAELLWKPSEERIKSANVTAFMEYVNKKYHRDFRDYWELYKWSVEYIPDFWESVWEFCGIICSKKYDTVVVDLNKFPGAKWFQGASLNYAENLLRFRDDKVALTFIGEGKRIKKEMTYRQLYSEVARLARALRNIGVKKGDRVVAYAPNTISTVVAFLAASSIGAIWASCGPELGVEAVVDRFGQLEPKIMFTGDVYYYKGRQFDILRNIPSILDKLPSVEKVIVASYNGERPSLSGISKAVLYDEFVTKDEEPMLEFEQLPPEHPHIVLFSSGVTGKPKCIVHGLAGTLIVHAKTHILHFDIKRDDVVLFLSSPTWMVWNLQVSALLTGCRLILFDGNPFYPHPEFVFELIENERITHFGCGAAFILNLMRQGLRPKERYDLSSLKVMFQTAAPLPPEGFKYVYEAIKEDICFLSGLGGTDVQCGIVEGTPIQPVYAGQMPGPALGFAVKVYDEEGKPIYDQPGELVVEKPFPSTPLYFWGDPSGEKYMETYFSKYPNVWRHGDFAIYYSDTGGITGLGRSDYVLKPSGVRIGPAEIYNIVEKIEGVEDSLVVGQYYKGDQRVILFVKMKEGYRLTEELKEKIKKELMTQASPRHVPDKIIEVPEIPYTVNMKKVESAVYNIVNGRPVLNRDALLNPKCLDIYEEITRTELRD